jgi:hypothetical protein
MFLQITEIDNEPLSNYNPEDLRFDLTNIVTMTDEPSDILMKAKAVLWDERWTPGSIAWYVADEGSGIICRENM